jgi:hypothetical protein
MSTKPYPAPLYVRFVMKTIEQLESTVSRLLPEGLARFLNWFKNFVSRQESIQRDMEIINRHVEELNREAEDVLDYQVFP